MKLRFTTSKQSFRGFPNKDSFSEILLELLGQPLIVRNINIANKVFGVDTVIFPEGYPDIFDLIQGEFPALVIDRQTVIANDGKGSRSSIVAKNHRYSAVAATDFLDMPLNSVLHNFNGRHVSIVPIVYPWDWLKNMKRILDEEIIQNLISPSARIAKSSIIDGPCIIGDDVVIDDYCKIKGPTFIGRGAFIGMGSLVRNCMIGPKTKIGFNCEVARSYFVGYDEIAHHNVILDSFIGKNVWLGGYTGTANVLLNRKNVKYEIRKGKLIDTGTNSFGAVVGDNASIGASVIILPGRQVPMNSIIQAGTIYGKKN